MACEKSYKVHIKNLAKELNFVILFVFDDGKQACTRDCKLSVAKSIGLSKSLSGILFLFLFFVGCEKSEVEILQERLDAFTNILPEEVREEFDSKNYEKVVAGLDSLLEHAPAFKEKYQKLKNKEAINVFSTQEVVGFFKVYFVEKIEKLKGEKEKKW